MPQLCVCMFSYRVWKLATRTAAFFKIHVFFISHAIVNHSLQTWHTHGKCMKSEPQYCTVSYLATVHMLYVKFNSVLYFTWEDSLHRLNILACYLQWISCSAWFVFNVINLTVGNHTLRKHVQYPITKHTRFSSDHLIILPFPSETHLHTLFSPFPIAWRFISGRPQTEKNVLC